MGDLIIPAAVGLVLLLAAMAGYGWMTRDFSQAYRKTADFRFTKWTVGCLVGLFGFGTVISLSEQIMIYKGLTASDPTTMVVWVVVGLVVYLAGNRAYRFGRWAWRPSKYRQMNATDFEDRPQADDDENHFEGYW